MPETAEERAASGYPKEKLDKRINEEWVTMSELLDSANIPTELRTTEISIPAGEIGDDPKIETSEGESLYLTQPERLGFLIAKCNHFIEIAHSRKISDFEPISRHMESLDGNILFVLKESGACFLVESGKKDKPLESWASIDEAVVDIELKEQGK